VDGRDVVMRAVEFREPGRIPLAKGDAADIGYVGYGPARDFAPAAPKTDEWGCAWDSFHPDEGDQGQVTGHPLADWDAMDRYEFPDPLAAGRLDAAPAAIRRLRAEGKFVCGGLGRGPMHLLPDLRGFEDYLTDLVVAPERLERLLDGIFRFLSGLTERYADLGCDAVIFYDDQATQSGPLFSMDLWRERFKPRYRDLFAQVHERGMKAYMHTCGNLSQYLPELVDAGVDIIDNKQPALWMDSPGAAAVRGQVAFSSCIDIQSRIREIELSEIPREVERLVRALSVPEGGFIGTYYHQADLRIPAAKTTAMLDAFRAFRWDG